MFGGVRQAFAHHGHDVVGHVGAELVVDLRMRARADLLPEVPDDHPRRESEQARDVVHFAAQSHHQRHRGLGVPQRVDDLADLPDGLVDGRDGAVQAGQGRGGSRPGDV